MSNYMNRNYLFSDEAYLIDEDYAETDKYGNYITTTKEQKIFCNVLGINRNEFYNAGNHGYKLAFNLIINDFEFSNQEKIRYKDKVYNIVRIYPLKNGVVELTLGERVGEELRWHFMKH